MMNDKNYEPMELTDDDARKHRFISMLGYFIFFMPLILAPDSKFARFHANQGLLLFIFFICIWILSSAIPLLGWLVIGPIGTLILLFLAIIGILNAISGRVKPLPFIGKYKLIK